MEIRMSALSANKLAKFLNKKYWQRSVKLAQEGKKYSQRQMAKEIGIGESALRRMMDEKVRVANKGMTLEYLSKVMHYFGDEFSAEFELKTPEPGQEGLALLVKQEEMNREG